MEVEEIDLIIKFALHETQQKQEQKRCIGLQVTTQQCRADMLFSLIFFCYF
jgi:hypothetical protein